MSITPPTINSLADVYEQAFNSALRKGSRSDAGKIALAVVVRHVALYLLELRHECADDVLRPRMTEALIQLSAQSFEATRPRNTLLEVSEQAKGKAA